MSRGAIIRGDSTKKQLALVFTGDEYADAGETIRLMLRRQNIPASFFFTGRFYHNPKFAPLIRRLKKDGHYLGAHSNDHLLYCDWTKRDSQLVTRDSFRTDLQRNEAAMKPFGLSLRTAPLFLPPYEWYNDSIAAWTKAMGLTLVNNTPGTLSHTDYTGPADQRYFSNEVIFRSLENFEAARPAGFNGFLLLFHVGARQPRDPDFYRRLETFLKHLKNEGYQFVRVDAVLL